MFVFFCLLLCGGAVMWAGGDGGPPSALWGTGAILGDWRGDCWTEWDCEGGGGFVMRGGNRGVVAMARSRSRLFHTSASSPSSGSCTDAGTARLSVLP